MEVVLSAIGLVIGVVAAVFSYVVPSWLAPPGRVEGRPRIGAGFGLALVLIVVLGVLALAKHPPFSSGQHLAAGYLIAGLAALVGALACSRLLNPGFAYWPYPFALQMSMALVATSLTLLAFKGDPVEALLGCALGYTVVAGCFRITYATGRILDLSRALEAGAAVAITLSAACTRGVYHFHSRDERGWWAFPLALAAFWLLGQIISYLASASKLLSKLPVASMLISAVLSVALSVVLGSVLGMKLQPAESMVALLLTGAVTAALVIWLTLTAERETQEWPLWIQVAATCLLLALFLLVMSFKLFAGYGVAIALIAAWAVVGSALGMGAFAARLPLQVLIMGANFLLLELFLARPSLTVGQSDLSMHYALVGVVLGVLLPAVYSSLVLEAGVGRTFLLGFLGSLTPVVLLTLWGQDALLGLMVGLVARQGVAAGFVVLVAASEKWGPWQAPTALLALGMAVVTVQFSRSLAFLYDMPRLYKGYLAGGIAVIVVLWVVGLALYARARYGRAAKGSTPVSPWSQK
jgi:hypothetical protein